MKFDNQLTFCPELLAMIRDRRAVGRGGKVFEDLGSLSSLNNLITLRNICLVLKLLRTLEVRLGFGGSCLVFLTSHLDAGADPTKQHIAIDPYQSQVWDDCGLLAVERTGLMDYLRFCPGPSCIELPSLETEGHHFDLIYIDGSHLFEDVFIDFYFASRLLEERGIILFDACTDQHVRKVLRFIKTNCVNSFASFDLSPYRADQGKSIRYVLGGLVGKRQLLAFQKVGPSERSWNSRFANF